MNYYLEIRLSMLRTVLAVCKEYENEINSIPALAAAYAELKALVAQLEAILRQQITSIKGVTLDKNSLRDALAEITEIFASALASYATVSGNNELRSSVNYSKSKLLNLRDELMLGACNMICVKAGENLAALANYGISAAMYADFQTLFTNTIDKNEATATARIHRKLNTVQSKELIRKAIRLLKLRIDTNLKVLRPMHPEFYAAYVNARAIIDQHGKRHNINLNGDNVLAGNILGNITDAVSGDPIENARVELVEKAITIDTDDDGDFYFEEVPEGTHTLKVTREGYETYTETNYTVAKGEELTKEIALTPLPAIN